ncbi:2-dehydropantoate 2-reductase [Glaciecola sp. SC05]|uniref:2-dehydropantoate 2-reductase n=1 Tax=Glaciecola sp. SC05 TaxID=1987355 RepID=UPI0035283FC2
MTAKISQVSTNKHAHHLVFGAGLVGCYIGGALVQAKQDVTLVGRRRFMQQIQTNFVISDYTGNRVKVSPTPQCLTIEDIGESVIADVIWLTVKCTVLNDVIDDLRPLVDKNTIIICCQNGVSTHQSIAKAFVHNHVIRAMVPFNVVNDEHGVFHRGSQGDLILEVIPALDSATKWLARQLNTDILPVNISYHMSALQWAKLQLNLGNAVNAMADIPVKEMLETAVYRKFIAKLMEELLAITDKQKIKLPKIANLPNTWIPKVLKLPDRLFKLVAQKMLAVDPKVKTSMWWDLDQNKQTEIDFINGKVVSQAKVLDMTAPANKWMVSVVHQAQAGNRLSASEFKDALLQFEQEQKI